MRPLRLTLAGFGAFAGRNEIDFAALEPHGVYLIVGRTGAGKTTLFDAMTYALYGSSAKRVRPYWSDYRDPADRSAGPAFVELAFEHHGRTYVVRRSVVAPRPKSHVSVDATLRLDGADHALVTGDRAVTARVTALLGIDAAQFRQVVLLPQGEFQQFLHAKTDEKLATLQRVFDTALYGRITAEIAAIARERDAVVDGVRRDAAALEQQVRARVARLAGAVTPYGLDAPVALPAPAERGEVPPPEATPLDAGDLDRLVRGAAASADALTSLAAERSQAVDRARADLVTAEHVARRVDAHTALVAIDAWLDAHAGDVAAAQGLLAAGDRAAQVVAPARASRLADAAVDEARRRVEASAHTVADARRADVLVADAAAAVPGGARRPLLDGAFDGDGTAAGAWRGADAPELVEAVRQARERVSRAAEHHSEARARRRSAARAEAEAQQADERRAAAEAALAQAVARRDALDAELAALAPLLDDDETVMRARELAELERCVDELPAREQCVAEAQAAFADAVERAARAQLACEVAERAWRDDLAATLAGTLLDGEACPVCGSAEHPSPAAAGAEAGSDTLVATTRRRAADAARGESDARVRVELARAALDELRRTAAALPPAEARADLMARAAAVVDARTRRRVLAGERTTAEGAVLAATTAQGEAQAAAAEARARADAERAAADRAAALGSALCDPDLVPPCAAALDRLAVAIDQHLAACDRLHACEIEATAYARTLAGALAGAGFATVDEAEAALLDDARRGNLRALLDRAASARDERLAHRAVVGDEPVPAERPDVDRLAAHVTELQHASGQATSDAATAQVVAADLARLRDELAELRARGAAARAHADAAVRLSSCASGAGGAIGLQPWVVRELFGDVCEQANVRLGSLSGSRYQLVLDDLEDPADRRRKRGLDLGVFDAHTGRRRDVTSLSGGETFLASLALALGLADVVQQYAGGIELGALFVDEGFGSLDPEALALAVDVLRGLHRHGRVVGVISHVESMRAELPVGIEVRAGGGPSTVHVYGAAGAPPPVTVDGAVRATLAGAVGETPSTRSTTTAPDPAAGSGPLTLFDLPPGPVDPSSEAA